MPTSPCIIPPPPSTLQPPSPAAHPLKVAMLIQRYHPLIGGAERQVGAVAEHLLARGVQVSILTRRYPGLSAFEVVAGVPVYRLPIPGPKVIASLSFTLSALPLLARLRPHILHAHEVFSPATTAVAARRFLGVPVVVTAHRSGPLGDFQRLQRKFMGKSRLSTFRRQVDCFIPISQEIAQEMEAAGIPEQRRCPIPNGVDTARFAPVNAEARQALRQRLGLSGDPIAIFTGRLAPEKRVDQLIQAWPAVRAALPSAQLLLLGTGELEAALKAAAWQGSLLNGQSVHFAGAQEDVAPYLQAADLFVLPSAAEGLSVAMLEAMACGLPALVTNIGGAPDVITHAETGWLIPPDAPEQLLHGLLTLLGDPALRLRIGALACQKVETTYSLPVVVRQLHELYLRLAGWEGA